MKVLFLGNNRVGWQILRWLREQDENIVGLVLHPPDKRKFGEEIIRAAQVSPEHIFDGSRLREPRMLEGIRALDADVALSVFFGYILRPAFLDLFPAGTVNLHPSYLPNNRGHYPNVWSIVDGTPAGATLHYVDTGVDTGDIIARRRERVDPVDTGESLYRKLERACVALFKETWPLIRAGRAPRVPQNPGEGTAHRSADAERGAAIDLDRTYTARALIDLIRARTFPPYPGCFFVHEGRKVYLRLQMLYEEQLEEAGDGSVH